MGFELPPGTSVVTALVAIVLGAVLLFFGYRLFRAVLALAGFLAGAAIGGGIASLVSPGSELLLLVSFVVGGVLGALLFVGLYLAGVFVLGLAGGGMIGGAIAANLSGTAQVAVLVVAALAGGLLALKLQRVMIALSTALLGAGGLVAGGLVLWLGVGAVRALNERLVGGAGLQVWPDWAALGAWALLAAAGLAAQLRAGRRRPERT